MDEVTYQSKTRAQHYLSQCYLKGFSDLKNGFIIPIDIKGKRVLFPSNTKNLAQERDFNRVDIEGVAPNYLEDALGVEFEGNVSTALRNIENTNRFEGEDRNFILNLITLFAVRNPARRMQYNNMIEQGSKMVLSIAAQQVGRRVNGVRITEDFKRIVDEDKFNVILSRNEHIRAELSIFNELLPYFFRRKWMLIKASDNAQFITNDFPVVLIWKEPQKHKRSPGFGLRGTQVHFPLSKKLALIGDFDGVEESLIESKETVALINSNILAHAHRWVFSAMADFYFLDQSGECSFGIENYWESLEKFRQ